MNRRIMLLAGVTALLALSATSFAAPPTRGLTLAVTMTNDPASNQIKVYDASTLTLLQTLSTNGAGGASGNARGVRQFNGTLFAAVNNGSNTVAIYRRDGDRLKLDRVVTTTSAPVSVDFGNGHMYVAGATTVDSFVLQGNSVGSMDGTTGLRLVGGGVPPNGSTAQVGAVDEETLLVTLKTDPTPGTVDVVRSAQWRHYRCGSPLQFQPLAGRLRRLASPSIPMAPPSLRLAHSSQDGLFRDGAFTAVISAGQVCPVLDDEDWGSIYSPRIPAATRSVACSAPGTISSWTAWWPQASRLAERLRILMQTAMYSASSITLPERLTCRCSR